MSVLNTADATKVWKFSSHLSVCNYADPVSASHLQTMVPLQPSHSTADILKAPALALGLPPQPKFHVSITERQGTALGVIAHLKAPILSLQDTEIN